jgi:hypothetical protein
MYIFIACLTLTMTQYIGNIYIASFESEALSIQVMASISIAYLDSSTLFQDNATRLILRMSQVVKSQRCQVSVSVPSFLPF